MSESAARLPLFIYGTLHPDRAPTSIAVTAKRLRSIGRATIQGRLYDLGEYPGVPLGEDAGNDAGQRVPGELFLLPDGHEDEVLARLDAYEDYREGDPASLFLRERTMARLEDGSEEPCWVYVYNGAAGRGVRSWHATGAR